MSREQLRIPTPSSAKMEPEKIATITSDLKTFDATLKHYAEYPLLQRDFSTNARIQASLNPLTLAVDNYRLEDGSENAVLSTLGAAISPQPTTATPSTPSSAPRETDYERMMVIENSDYDTAWYSRYFLGTQHQVFLGLDDQKSHYVLTVLVDSSLTFRAILFRKEGAQRIQMVLEKKTDVQKMDLLKLFDPLFAKWPKPREVHDTTICKELLSLEETLISRKYKFGILLSRDAQVVDDEFFGNEHATPNFTEFIESLGDRVELLGWKGFRAGLDVTENRTGTHSIYTEFGGCEVMFHVSTMLPYSTINKQQLERKRHLGNDIAVVIFQESTAAPFLPTSIRTQFNHLFIVVRKETSSEGKPLWRVAVTMKGTVPSFGPPLPPNATFEDPRLMRRFILTKLINGENASHTAAAFLNARTRTMGDMLSRLHQQFSGRESALSPRRKSTTVLHDMMNLSQRIKDDMIKTRQTVRITLRHSKEDANGVATLHELGVSIEEEVLCGDGQGDDLLIGTATGLYLVDVARRKVRKVLSGLRIIQLSLLPGLGAVLILCGRPGKTEKLYMLPLSLLIGHVSEIAIPIGSLRPCKLPRTKGCHLFALSNSTHSDVAPLQVCAVIKTTLHVFHAEASKVDPRTGQATYRLKPWKEFYSPVVPRTVGFCDGDRQLCVGFKTEFDLIDMKTSKITELFVASSNIDVLTSTALNQEVLLSYSHMGIFRSVNNARATREYALDWMTIPSAIAYMFPYVLAFSNNMIEVRTLINGKLVQSIELPSMRFLTCRREVYVAVNRDGVYDIVQVLTEKTLQ